MESYYFPCFGQRSLIFPQHREPVGARNRVSQSHDRWWFRSMALVELRIDNWMITIGRPKYHLNWIRWILFRITFLGISHVVFLRKIPILSWNGGESHLNSWIMRQNLTDIQMIPFSMGPTGNNSLPWPSGTPCYEAFASGSSPMHVNSSEDMGVSSSENGGTPIAG